MPLHASLEGKNLVITGGSKGIGKAIALRFAAEGARVLIASRTKRDLRLTTDELCRIRTGCLSFPADVSLEPEVRRLAAYAFQQLGEVHILVNNAGLFPVTPFRAITAEEWQQVMRTNLDGPFFCSRVFGEQMIARGTHGRILNIGSTSSLVARPGVAHYAASKAALNMLTRVLALEMAPYGITVNALCPGLIATAALLAQAADPRNVAEHEARLNRIPVGRLGKPEEVAAAALFMVSDEADYLTGATLVLDGGYSAGMASCFYGVETNPISG